MEEDGELIAPIALDWCWVRDLTAPLHLGLINGPFVPLQSHYSENESLVSIL